MSFSSSILETSALVYESFITASSLAWPSATCCSRAFTLSDTPMPSAALSKTEVIVFWCHLPALFVREVSSYVPLHYPLVCLHNTYPSPDRHGADHSENPWHNAPLTTQEYWIQGIIIRTSQRPQKISERPVHWRKDKHKKQQHHSAKCNLKQRNNSTNIHHSSKSGSPT